MNFKKGQFALLKNVITVKDLFFLCVPLEPICILLHKYFFLSILKQS